jgi:hypothetical protein
LIFVNNFKNEKYIYPNFNNIRMSCTSTAHQIQLLGIERNNIKSTKGHELITLGSRSPTIFLKLLASFFKKISVI